MVLLVVTYIARVALVTLSARKVYSVPDSADNKELRQSSWTATPDQPGARAQLMKGFTTASCATNTLTQQENHCGGRRRFRRDKRRSAAAKGRERWRPRSTCASRWTATAVGAAARTTAPLRTAIPMTTRATTVPTTRGLDRSGTPLGSGARLETGGPDRRRCRRRQLAAATRLPWPKKSCYIVCLRSSVDLSRHPGGPRQLHNPDTLHDMFSSDGRSTHVHTHSPYKHTTARTHQNIHAHTNYMVLSSLSFL